MEIFDRKANFAHQQYERRKEEEATKQNKPIHIIKRRRNSVFTDREAELDRLYAILEGDGQTRPTYCIVSGSGGVGKTQIASAFVYKYMSCYDAIFWVPARDKSELSSTYSAIGKNFSRFAPESVSQAELESTQEWLQQTSKSTAVPSA